MRASIPLADAAAFGRTARRTALLRLGLAAALAGTFAAAVLSVPGSRGGAGLLDPGTSPIVVLDVSASVSSAGQQREIAAALRNLSSGGGRLGLVVFSDVAYEALPPGTPASELRPLVRFFERPPGPRSPRTAPRSPWAGALSGGTKIWAGLALAREMLRRDRVENGSVVLVSDLADAPNDRAQLADAIVAYVRDGIPLRVVALDPEPEDERLFRGFLERPGALVRVEQVRDRRLGASAAGAFPAGLVAAGAALLLLLALNEHLLGPLAWRRRAA
jgi:hypothetical protein